MASKGTDGLSGLIPACAGKTVSFLGCHLFQWAHPRVCGENDLHGQLVGDSEGSSPRVRGKPLTVSNLVVQQVAHPRVCGENWSPSSPPLMFPGSSPRVRGKQYPARRLPPTRGLIPACAGKTNSDAWDEFMITAHPRVCGENGLLSSVKNIVSGSSPRVRGKRLDDVVLARRERLIPACAGKTDSSEVHRNHRAAHPRVCGENTPSSLSK